MSTCTENYNLIKPDEEDLYDVTEFNENMDAIDAQMMETETAIEQMDEKIGTPMQSGNTLFSLLENGGGSLIKSLQHIVHTLPTNTTSSSLSINEVDTTKTLVLFERLGDVYGGGCNSFTYELSATALTLSYEKSSSHRLYGFWIIEFN